MRTAASPRSGRAQAIVKNDCLLDLARNGRERRRQAGTNSGNRTDDDDCNESSDQAVFNGRCAGLVANEASEKVVHVSLHNSDTLGRPAGTICERPTWTAVRIGVMA